MKLSLEVSIIDHINPNYDEVFEVSDGSELIYESYVASCPKIRLHLKTWLDANYLNKDELATVDISLKLMDETTTFLNCEIPSIPGKKRYLYGAVFGTAAVFFNDVDAYVKETFGEV